MTTAGKVDDASISYSSGIGGISGISYLSGSGKISGNGGITGRYPAAGQEAVVEFAFFDSNKLIANQIKANMTTATTALTRNTPNVFLKAFKSMVIVDGAFVGSVGVAS